MSDRREELRNIAKDMLPDPIIIIGYLEHQIDLMAKVISDLLPLVDTASLSPDAQTRIEKLNEILTHSSVDFNNINSPLESYKIPTTVQLKGDTREVQKRYLNTQVKEGIF